MIGALVSLESVRKYSVMTWVGTYSTWTLSSLAIGFEMSAVKWCKKMSGGRGSYSKLSGNS